MRTFPLAGTSPGYPHASGSLTIRVLTSFCGSVTMSKRDKGLNNIGIYVESKEGERGPLSRNKANVRSPSLANNNYIFSEETVAALSELGHVLRRIRRRLHS